MFKASVVYEKNLNSTAKIVVNQGGTYSTKTYSILQVLFTKAVSIPKQVITVVGQDIPNLKKGALRDAQNIVNDSPLLSSQIESYYIQDRIYYFKNGSIIEFNSYDTPQDAKSGKRDYLFINECNGVPKPIYDELQRRTNMQTFLDYNPNEAFWVHDQLLHRNEVQLIISDHRHNPFISQDKHNDIESIEDKELWKVYARGLTGKIEGLIFPDVNIVQAVPIDATLIGYGLDFGFTNDPTAMYEVYKHSGELFINELLYDTRLTNPIIADRWKALNVQKNIEIIADSAEPKSIAELSSYGYQVKGAPKGPDSLKNGIDILKRWKMNITSSSTGLRKEAKAYKWAVDKDGNSLNQPIDSFNHGWDACRYLALVKLSEYKLQPASRGRRF